jgi:Carboxypeptidase regulatory-like domain
MRSFVRLCLALVTALTFCVSLPPAQQAQTKRGPGKLAPTSTATTVSNYQVQATTGALVPGTTKLTGFANLDDGTAPLQLPFDYTLYDQTFLSGTNVNVSTNGNLQFVSNNNDYGQAAVCFPLNQFSYLISPFWSDLSIAGTNEGVFSSVSGTAPNRIFNVEWRASFIGSAPATLDFEVRLYEGQTRFDIVYGAVPGGGRFGSEHATVGVQQGAGTTFTEYDSICNDNSLLNGQTLVFTGTNNTTLFIAGLITDTDNNPLSGVTVALTDNSNNPISSTMTGVDGLYQFTGLTAGSSYKVTPSLTNFNFFPASRGFGSGSFRAFNGNFIVNFIRTIAPQPGDVLISEFRFHGPTGIGGDGSLDEFVELYNNTNSTIVVNTTDNTSGWVVQASRPSPSPSPQPLASIIVPNGTAIPPRGHYLAGSGSGYNLGNYSGTPDMFLPLGANIPDDAGVAVFNTANMAALDAQHVLDAVGFSGEPNALYREGAGLQSPGAVDGQYSWVRKMNSGTPQDTNDNANDFAFVSIDGGVYGGVQSTLGAPGPESLSSPIQRNAQIKVALIDTGCTGTTTGGHNSDAAGGTCPRVRDTTPGTNATTGTLSIRRAFKNSTGAQVTQLRFRIVDITTAPAVGTADLRALTSTDVSATCINFGVGCPGGPGSTVTIRGTTLEQPPNQPNGGGLNSSLAAGTVTLNQPLANGATINVQFLLGVVKGGTFRIFVNVEALP